MAEEFEIPSDPETDARPVIVVQSRRRGPSGSLAWAVVILVVAGAVWSHRVRSRDWRGVAHLLHRKMSTAPEAAPAPPAEAAPAPSRPVVVTVADVATPPIPQPRPEARPFAALPPVPLAIALPPAAVLAAATPALDQKVETALALADINREAERNKAKKARDKLIEDDKARLFASDQKTVFGRQVEREARQQAAADEEREAFRKDLSRKLKLMPAGQAGDAIEELCDQKRYKLGAGYKPGQVKVGVFTDAGRRERVEELRSSGVSEPKILDLLVRQEMAQMVSRSGPRNKTEAIERAARQLLKVPLNTSSSRSRPAADAPPERSRVRLPKVQ